MKNYKIYILIFIIIITLPVLYLFFSDKSRDSSKIKIENKSEEEIEEEVNLEIYTSDYKLIFQAVIEKNDKYCKHLEDATMDECLYDIGSVNREIEFCEMINDQELRDDCVESIATFMLIDTSNIEVCDNLKIERYRDQCYKEILKTKNDIEFCKEVSVDYIDICNDIIYQNIALEEKDSSACNNINSDFYKNNCEIIINNLPIDSDGDGISDEEEMMYGTDPFVEDSKLLD